MSPRNGTSPAVLDPHCFARDARSSKPVDEVPQYHVPSPGRQTATSPARSPSGSCGATVGTKFGVHCLSVLTWSDVTRPPLQSPLQPRSAKPRSASAVSTTSVIAGSACTHAFWPGPHARPLPETVPCAPGTIVSRYTG